MDLNFCSAVEASLVVNALETKEQRRDYLDINCTEKEIISLDKVIYNFSDGSFIFCDGLSISARASDYSKAEFFLLN